MEAIDKAALGVGGGGGQLNQAMHNAVQNSNRFRPNCSSHRRGGEAPGAKVYTSALSGGMKRRLCMGIALIGGSRLVFLGQKPASPFSSNSLPPVPLCPWPTPSFFLLFG